MTTETTTRICEHLEKYVFDKIWNDPYSEYRTFIVPECLSTEATAGVFFGRYNKIQLPSTVAYRDKNSKLFFYMFAVPAAYFRSLKVNATTWVSLDRIGSNGILDFEFFSDQGKHSFRAGTFIMQSPVGDCIYIAMEQYAFHTCFGAHVRPDGSVDGSDDKVKFFFGKYVDSDLEQSTSYECFRLKTSDIPSTGSKLSSYDPILASGIPDHVFYNGNLLIGDYRSTLVAGSLVEKVIDGNLIGTVEVPVDLEHTYQPTQSFGIKLLVHIPKSINKDNAIITPNTCDLYLIPTKMKEGFGNICTSSIYLYQCGRGDKFTQLTHNDFSIDYEWLESLAKEHGFEECVVQVLVRRPIKNKFAIRDANYLNLLYTHTDDEIVDFLMGRSKFDIPFWTAKSLENSLYGLATLKRRDLNKQYTIAEFVDLIGYYHTLALIGKRVTHFEITSKSIGNKEFIVNAPLALCDLKASEFYPLVYVNGIRVDQSMVSVRSGAHVANRHCREITFTPDASWWTKVVDMTYSTKLRVVVENIELNVGDKVVIELLDNQYSGAIVQYDVDKDTEVHINNPNNFSVYEVLDDTDNNNVVYEKVFDAVTLNEETGLYKFNDSLIGRKVVIVDGSITLEDEGTHDVSHESVYHIGKSLWENALTDDDKTYYHPLDSEIVFMNDHCLIRGLDYTMSGYRNPSRREGVKLYIQNVSYLRNKNAFQVIRTNQKMLSHQRGYLTGNIVTWNHQNPFWFDELSVMTIGGRVCSNLLHEFGTLTISDSHDNGVPYEYRMSVSTKISDILNDHGKSQDDTKLRIIQEYFQSKYSFPDHISIVKHPYLIYSLYLEQIISDYLKTDFDFRSIASQELFEEQFSNYDEWKSRDIVFGLTPHDLLYVDISPTYNTLKITDGYHYRKLSELIQRLMPKDAHRYKDTRNGRK
jgi:hypothetical protein